MGVCDRLLLLLLLLLLVLLIELMVLSVLSLPSIVLVVSALDKLVSVAPPSLDETVELAVASVSCVWLRPPLDAWLAALPRAGDAGASDNCRLDDGA